MCKWIKLGLKPPTDSSAATYSFPLTTVSWGLQAVLGEGTPAHGEDVPGVILAPVVEGPPPPIEHDKHLIAPHVSNGGGADQVRVLLVHGLQLHAGLKKILGGSERLLKRHIQTLELGQTERRQVDGDI